jgi:hypothetical protein
MQVKGFECTTFSAYQSLRFDTLNIALSYKIRSIASGLFLLLINFGRKITTSHNLCGWLKRAQPNKRQKGTSWYRRGSRNGWLEGE